MLSTYLLKLAILNFNTVDGYINRTFFNRYNDRFSKSFSSGYYAFKAYLMKKLK